MSSSPQNSADFYDGLAARYDAMMAFEDRLAAAARWVQAYQQRFRNFTSAVDIGCGTGAYALAIAKIGASAMGVDVSPRMLEKARIHAQQSNLDASFVEAGLETAAEHINAPTDLILCMGNTLPHILSSEQLTSGFVGLSGKLAPDGNLVLQLLNYEKILGKRERVVGVSRHENNEFIRFYDFIDPLLRFNLLEVDWRSGVPQTRMDATTLYPYRYEELQSFLGEAGFGRIELFGGLDFSDFAPLSSETLMLVAGR